MTMPQPNSARPGAANFEDLLADLKQHMAAQDEAELSALVNKLKGRTKK